MFGSFELIFLEWNIVMKTFQQESLKQTILLE